jgi:hypothetical protein
MPEVAIADIMMQCDERVRLQRNVSARYLMSEKRIFNDVSCVFFVDR